MDIAKLSTSLSQQNVQQTAAVQVQKMAIDGARDQGESLVRMMDTAQTITDPNLGNRVDLFA